MSRQRPREIELIDSSKENDLELEQEPKEILALRELYDSKIDSLRFQLAFFRNDSLPRNIYRDNITSEGYKFCNDPKLEVEHFVTKLSFDRFLLETLKELMELREQILAKIDAGDIHNATQKYLELPRSGYEHEIFEEFARDTSHAFRELYGSRINAEEQSEISRELSGLFVSLSANVRRFSLPELEQISSAYSKPIAMDYGLWHKAEAIWPLKETVAMLDSKTDQLKTFYQAFDRVALVKAGRAAWLKTIVQKR